MPPATALLLLAALATAPQPALAPLPSQAAVLADGQRAFAHWAALTPLDNCDWTGSTFTIGLMEYYKATVSAGAADAAALGYARNWAAHYDYQLCEPKAGLGLGAGAGVPPGKHDADHQLCGATYVELFKLDRNASHLADIVAVLGEEMEQAEATSNYWSWVDALHMAMSTYSRMGNATGEARYFAKQWLNFNASALSDWDEANPCCHKAESSCCRTFAFWNPADQLYCAPPPYL